MIKRSTKTKLFDEIHAGAQASKPNDRLTEAVLELASAAAPEGLLVAWHELWTVPRDWAPRIVAFALARCADTYDDALWPVASSLLASPTVTDSSAMINTVTALQLLDSDTPLARAVLRVDLSGFVARCLNGIDPVRKAGADLLIRLHDVGTLTKVLERHEATDLLRIADALDSLGRRRTALQECLRPDAFQETVALDEKAISVAVSGISEPSGGSRWAVAVQSAARAARQVLEDIPVSFALSRELHATEGMVQQLRLNGANVGKGRIKLTALEQVLRAWHRLFETAYFAVAAAKGSPRPAPPSIFALTPQAGSYALRFQVLHEGNATTVSQAFEESAQLAEGRATVSHLERQSEATSAVALLHGALKSEDLELTIDMTDTSARSPRARARIFKSSTERVLESVRFSTAEEGEEHIPGILEGANHKTGRVEIALLDGSGGIQCNTPPSSRGLLVNKVIGKTYIFTLGRETTTRDLGQEGVKWTLLGVQSADRSVPSGDESAAKIFPSDGPVPSELIPQQDNLDRISQIVAIIASGTMPTPENMSMPHGNVRKRKNSERHVDYMKQGAKILGLLSDSGLLTEVGRTLACLGSHDQKQLMSFQFQSSAVGRAWMAWAGVDALSVLDPDSAVSFLKARGVKGGKPLTVSMVERRGRTLRRWVREFQAL